MISAVVLAKNEEKNIVDCLETLSFCDEIIVVDDNSEDRTVEIAKKMGASVFTHSLHQDFGQQRNFGLEKARNQWVLFVDVDERVSQELKNEIVSSLRSTNVNGYYIGRIDNMWGKSLMYGETGEIKLLRLGKKETGAWVGKVHEQWKIKGKTKTFKNPLYHFPHRNMSEFLKEINYYTNIRSKELFDKGIKVKWYSIILYPKAKFILNYFIKLGFLDGVPGLIFAMTMSLHSFLVRSKLWLLWQKKQQS